MTDSLKLAEMQRTSIEFERQRHLANWFIKSSPHMATPATPLSTNGVVGGGASSGAGGNSTNNTSATQSGNAGTKNGGTPGGSGKITTTNPLFFLMASNGSAAAAVGNPNGIPVGGKHGSGAAEVALHPPRAHPAMSGKGNLLTPATHHVEARKPKLRRFNSHDTGANMFSVADFENARLARRNEIEMKQRLQRRMKMSAQGLNGGYAGLPGCGGLGGYGSGSLGGDCSTGDSKGSRRSNDSQTEPLPAEIFLDRYTLPRVVRISYKTKFSHETLQSSSSSNGSSTATTASSTQSSSGTGGMGSGTTGTNGTNGTTGTTSSSTASSSGNINTSNTNNNNNNGHHVNGNSAKHGGNASSNTATSNGLDQAHQQAGELFLLYRLVRQRQVFHGFNAKTGVANRKKGVMIPQEFPGYFSLINEKGLPTATLYTSLIQLVRERVYKFVSVENMSAFTESQPTAVTAPPANDGCLPGGYLSSSAAPVAPPPPSNRPQYVKTTARGGQVFRLLAVFEDGKQDHSNSSLTYKPNSGHGREKEKGRYAQLLNDQRQVLYVPLGTKGKFYEIEPGIPQILQKLSASAGSGAEQQRKVNPDCVHRITALVAPHRELPQTLRFISGPAGSATTIPEQLTVSKISAETVIIACPIDDVEAQSPIHLRKLQLSAEMQLVKCTLGFETEQRMFANPNVQNILRFCQFNCDQFLRMVEVEVLSRPERSGSKSRGGDALRILKPLHLPKLLRREKTAIAHEKEDSIIFLSKHDLANLEAKEQQKRHAEGGSGSNRISDKMKVFQSTKKKWFRRQDKHAVTSLTSLDLDVQVKRLSMERYNDMSKLLQERFGEKRTSSSSHAADESVSERSASELGCSDTETTTLHSTIIEDKLQKFGPTKPLLQKSLSLQDVELIACSKPDLLRSHHTAAAAADTISEAGTDLEDMENRPPSRNADGLLQQSSFITEKLYTEFHVKTRQYSKSSSSLHQLQFSAPQKLQQRSTLAQLKQQQLQSRAGNNEAAAKKLDFNIGEPVTGRRAAGGLLQLAANVGGGGGGGFFNTSNWSQNTSSLVSPLSPTSLLEDDLPYSSVRDSLVLSSDDSSADQAAPGQICQALHLIDYAKENIYAEICHDAAAMGGAQRDTEQLRRTDHEDDQYGDYASLTPPYMSIGSVGGAGVGAAGGTVATGAAQAISRVHINFSSSPVSYHTVYLGDEPLGEHYAAARKVESRVARNSSVAADLANVTTVECVPPAADTNGGLRNPRVGDVADGEDGDDDNQVVDNIYNTLK